MFITAEHVPYLGVTDGSHGEFRAEDRQTDTICRRNYPDCSRTLSSGNHVKIKMTEKEINTNQTQPADCCCGQSVSQEGDRGLQAAQTTLQTSASFVIGTTRSAIGDIPLVSTRLTREDRWGAIKSRWTIGRMSYRVEPGLYAVGQPASASPVFVSANYKLSFDHLRKELADIDGWILAIDTRGINVWCAAGKGTFGTDEIVKRVETVRLKDIVSHRRLILPQLGAPGVAAHEVKDRCGFKVIYGPVRAEDIPAFLAAGRKASVEMRRVKFPLQDRSVLIPAEIVLSTKYAVLSAAALLLLSGLGPGIYDISRVASVGLPNAAALLLSVYLGAALPPLLLPWLPGRSFSLKGVWVGLLAALVCGWLITQYSPSAVSFLSLASWFFIAPAVASFLAMNFTGSSTYTSLSGVLKEMKVALPLQIGGAAVGLGLWITGLFV